VSISEHQAWREDLAGRQRKADALAAIEDKLGRDAMPHFLNTPQPGLGGQTGAEALQDDPEAVANAIEANPIFDRLPQRRSSKSTNRLLGILDSLNREGRAR
jgi:hypothetical protein